MDMDMISEMDINQDMHMARICQLRTCKKLGDMGHKYFRIIFTYLKNLEIKPKIDFSLIEAQALHL